MFLPWYHRAVYLPPFRGSFRGALGPRVSLYHGPPQRTCGNILSYPGISRREGPRRRQRHGRLAPGIVSWGWRAGYCLWRANAASYCLCSLFVHPLARLLAARVVSRSRSMRDWPGLLRLLGMYWLMGKNRSRLANRWIIGQADSM